VHSSGKLVIVTSPQIRHVEFDGFGPWIHSMRTTYLMDPATPITDPIRAWWQRIWDSERIWGAFDAGRCVATLRTFPTTLTVPSGSGPRAEIETDALTQVSVAGTHRRRGVLTSMLTESLSDARERGDVVSALRAAEWPIYGRYGYAVASQDANYRISTVPQQQILAPQRPVSVAQVAPATLGVDGPKVLARARGFRSGQINRPPSYWERILGLEGLPPDSIREPICITARDEDGACTGYAVWTAKDGDWFADRIEVNVHELISIDGDAYRALWAYLLNLDLTKTLLWRAQAVDEPLEWLLPDGRAARREWTMDGLWLRILDVEQALSTRRYAIEDRLVLEVIDEDAGGWAAGRYTLDGGPEHANCRRSPEASPDLRLSQRALAALYLGGQTVWSQAQAGLIDEETPRALHRLESMTWTAIAPWNATPF
jgi:predicted acetyltransferase